MWAKQNAVRKEEVVKLVDDHYRKLQAPGATDLASKGLSVSNVGINTTLKEEVVGTLQKDKVRCLCGNTSKADSMIKCEDKKCNVWQHGASNCGRFDIAKALFQDLTNKGLHPNVRTYSVMISGLCREGLVAPCCDYASMTTKGAGHTVFIPAWFRDRLRGLEAAPQKPPPQLPWPDQGPFARDA